MDERRRWFNNEWFFKWHFIGNERSVTIDSFDGRGIHYGGIKFSGTARDVYWDAVVRGVRKEITEQFAWVDQEVRQYNRETALQAIDECAGQLVSFVSSIRRAAIKKDSTLRGDGTRFPAEDDAGNWAGTSNADIASQAEALKRALPLPTDPARLTSLAIAPTRRQRAASIWHENQWWLGPIALLVGLVSLYPLIS